MLLALIALLWLISPIVLFIILTVQIGNSNDLKRQNKALLETIRQLTEAKMKNSTNMEFSENNAPASSGEIPPASDKTADIQNAPAPKPASESAEIPKPVPVQDSAQNSAPQPVPAPLPYNMPYLAQIPPQAPEKHSESTPESIQGTVSRDEEKSAKASHDAAAVPNRNAPEYASSEKKSVSTINVILILGAMLISLAGFIFASATWDSLNMFFKTALLLSFSALFFGIHSLAERKLKLEQTGRVFYILGSIFLPAAIAAAGFLNVFGEFFSFSGEGRAAVFSAMFFSVCIPFFKGAHDYKIRAFAAISFASFSASAVSLIWQLSPGGDVAALFMAIFALAVILTEPFVVKLFAGAFGEESIFLPEWKRFASLNAWVLSILSLFMFGLKMGFVSLAAFAIFSVCFLKKSVTDSNGTAGTFGFAFFIIIAVLVGFEPDELSGFTVIIASVSLIYAVLSAMGLFPDTVRKIMRILAIIAAGIAALLGFAENISIIASDSTPSLTLIFAAATVFSQFLILELRNKTGEYKALSFGAMLWLSAEVTLLITGMAGGRPYAFAAAYGFMLIYFAAIRFTGLKERLYSSANDIIVAIYAFICMVICTLSIGGVAGGIVGAGILLAGVVLSILSRQESFSAAICSILTALCIFPLIEIFYETGFCSAAAAAAGTISLIYAVLSAMGLFTDTAKKIMQGLAIAAAGIAALLGFAENISIIASDKTPSLVLIFAAAAVFAQLLLLALRNKTGEYKAMSFGAMLWLSAEVILLITGNTGARPYAFAAAYGSMLIYFAAARFTGLRERLYSPANDIIMAIYAFTCAAICTLSIGGIAGGITGLGILLAGIILSAVSRQESFSAVICPILTALCFFPLMEIFYETDFRSVPAAAAGTIIIILCAAAAVLLLSGKAPKYIVSYGISVVAAIPIFTLISLVEGVSYYIPMVAVTCYTAVYLFGYAFPRERYSHVNLLFSAILLTAFFVGGHFTSDIYLLCFPAGALLLIFAVYILASSMGGFEKIGETTEKFLWFVMPVFSGILMLAAEASATYASLPVIIVGAVLSLCTVFLSMFRRNTMNMIFPLVSAIIVMTREASAVPFAVFVVILGIAGQLMFRKKLFDKQFSDIFSIGAVFSAGIFLLKIPYTRMKVWISIVLLAATIANLVRREHSLKINRILLTISTAFLFPIWWTQPFFELPKLIVLEWNLLPAVIFCVILRFIWRENPAGVYTFSFITAIVCLVILFIGALISGESFDSVFIGVVLLIMLAISFIIKRKRWFVLAVASMVTSAALLSIRQLDSFAWLVYLVLTGAALITLGVMNEIKKQQKRSGEETKLTRFMSDWTW